jgi:hypothetical protein
VTALREFRHDLANHLAAGLEAAAAPLGAQVNPPAVVVQPGVQYVTASTYCEDAIAFDVFVIPTPGDVPAVMDALDDLIDRVRSTLRTTSPEGHRYSFQGVGGLVTYAVGDRDYPAVTVSVIAERLAP